MNTNDENQPDLTAYALGELDHANDQAVQAMLTEHPDLRAEVDSIAELGHLLHASAPVLNIKLRPEQKRTILNGPQRVREMVESAKKVSRDQKKPVILPFITGMVRLSAAAAVVVGAFLLGQKNGPLGGDSGTTVVIAPEKPTQAPATEIVSAQSPSTALGTLKVAPPIPPAPKAPVVAVQTETPKPSPALPMPAAPVIEQPKKLEVAVVSSAKAAEPAPSMPTSLLAVSGSSLLNTAQTPDATFSFKPSVTRPQIAKDSTLAAAPITQNANSGMEANKNRRAPDLKIHSCRTEVTSCPWDASKRLVRVSFQIPGYQEASVGDFGYDFKVNFPATQVRNFRPVAQRAVVAQTQDGAAVHTVWYEVTLNGTGNPNGKSIGSVQLPANSSFTHPALALFDNNRLQIIDRGTAWQSAPDDYLFESAVVGLGIILESQVKPAGLSLSQIETLAQRATQSGDRTGERAKFLKLVKELRKAAGV
ncbi:MAG: DUF3520 domain-containing protein [Verrucomicrobiaceae bacterium]|nr:DUF3520 domain-containing protein [Verrucomicrobiaceae bacterium]